MTDKLVCWRLRIRSFSTDTNHFVWFRPFNAFAVLWCSALLSALLFLPGKFVAANASSERVMPGSHRSEECSSEQNANDLPLLSPVERELKGGESHSYRISLASGQFLYGLV